jgi:hypothetical protein
MVHDASLETPALFLNVNGTIPLNVNGTIPGP